MTFTYSYDTSQPPNSQSPAYGAQRIRTLAEAIQERLTQDHLFAKGDGVDTVDSDYSGMHTQVTFVAPLGVMPTGLPTSVAQHGVLFTGDVEERKDATPATVVELYYEGEEGDYKQITAHDGDDGVQCLNLELKDLVCTLDSDGASVLVDDSTIEIDTTNGIQLKDDGITGAKLGDDVADDDTLEVSSDALQIKVPAAGAGSDANFAPVMARGHYTGDDGTSRAIVVGFTIRMLWIKCTTTSNVLGAIQVVNGSANWAWVQDGQNALPVNDAVAISLTGTSGKFTLDASAIGGDNVNTDPYTYEWIAIGDRTSS